ncbi:MAG: LemA family protein [Puniceicoccaceae bacterium]|nr:MAG: LemA family protein [Puniceicoccaceae bacterium]
MRRADSLIEVELKRRHDLITRLLPVVTASREHERQTQESVAQLRTQTEASPPDCAGPDPTAVLPVVRALAERYPALQSDRLFGELQRSLSETEQRIALSREYYNTMIEYWNSRLETIPDGWVAKLGSFKPRHFFEASGFERAAVRLALAD